MSVLKKKKKKPVVHEKPLELEFVPIGLVYATKSLGLNGVCSHQTCTPKKQKSYSSPKVCEMWVFWATNKHTPPETYREKFVSS